MRRFTRLAVIVAACAVMGSVLSAQAPTPPLATADAGTFMGAWLLTLDSPQGPFSMTMTLTDVDGKVACELTSDMMPAQKVSDISKAGNDLVLKYQGDFQGQAFSAKITVTPTEEAKAGVTFDIMDGQFMMTGVGAKK